MPYYDRRRIAPGQSIVLLICLFLVSYFAYHTIKGKHGLEARVSLNEHALLSERRLTSLEVERARLERDVALMTKGSIDLDMLDEKARELLNLSHPDEMILLRDQPPQSVPNPAARR